MDIIAIIVTITIYSFFQLFLALADAASIAALALGCLIGGTLVFALIEKITGNISTRPRFESWKDFEHILINNDFFSYIFFAMLFLRVFIIIIFIIRIIFFQHMIDKPIKWEPSLLFLEILNFYI